MKSICSLLALVVLVSAATVSAQDNMDDLLHELIETEVNDAFRSDLGLLVRAEVNRIVTGSIDERIQRKINRNMNAAIENKLEAHESAEGEEHGM